MNRPVSANHCAKNTKPTFSTFALNPILEQLKKSRQEERFLFDDLVLVGQSTVFYAPPNTGKTLFIIHQLLQAHRQGQLDNLDVYFINADDSQNALIEKMEILKHTNIQTIVPGYHGFKAEMALPLMEGTIMAGTAAKTVIILDTVKKFADQMDKRNMTQFGRVLGEFVGAGGTVIALSHTNKNRDTSGKLVVAGTSDLLEDCNCSYVLDNQNSEILQCGGKSSTVVFENRKIRGNNSLELIFKYQFLKNSTYEQLVNSVNRVDVCAAHSELAKCTEEQKRNEFLAHYDNVAQSIIQTLTGQELPKTDLIKTCCEKTNVGRDTCRTVINYLIGNEIDRRMGGKTNRTEILFIRKNTTILT
jgi:hypothetical protein